MGYYDAPDVPLQTPQSAQGPRVANLPFYQQPENVRYAPTQMPNISPRLYAYRTSFADLAQPAKVEIYNRLKTRTDLGDPKSKEQLNAISDLIDAAPMNQPSTGNVVQKVSDAFVGKLSKSNPINIYKDVHAIQEEAKAHPERKDELTKKARARIADTVQYDFGMGGPVRTIDKLSAQIHGGTSEILPGAGAQESFTAGVSNAPEILGSKKLGKALAVAGDVGDATIGIGAGNAAQKGVEKLATQVSKDARVGGVLRDEHGFIAGPGAKEFPKAEAKGQTWTGPDGKQRFEVSDKNAQVDTKGVDKLNNHELTSLSDVLKHPEFDKQYDKLTKSVRVVLDDTLPLGREAVTDLNTRTIHLNGSAISNSTDPASTLRDVLLHERQHFVQAQEGMAVGTVPEVAAKVTSPIVRQLQSEIAKVKPELLAENKEYVTKRNNIINSVLIEDKDRTGLLKKLQEEYNYTPAMQKMDELQHRLAAEAKNIPDNTGSPRANYQNSLGEAEARSVAGRSDMSQKELNKNPVDPHYGVNPQDVVIDTKSKVAASDVHKPQDVVESSRKAVAVANKEIKANDKINAKELAKTATDDQLVKLSETHPELVAQVSRIRSEAEHGSPIRSGAIVKAADRDNFGKVVSINGDKARVRFVNKQAGTEATVTMKLDQLTSAAPGGRLGKDGMPVYGVDKESKIAKALLSTTHVIERQGKAGKELAGELRSMRDNHEIMQAQYLNKMPIMQKLSRKERSNIGDVIEGNAKPVSEAQARAVEEWKTIAPEIRERAVAAGLDVGDLGKNYFPHNIDFEVLNKKDKFNQAVNHLVETGQAEDQASAIQLLSYARDVARNREFGNLEASRLVDLPFYDKSRNAISDYLAGATKRIAQVEQFGPGDERALKLLAKIGNEGKDMETAKKSFDVAIGAQKYESNLISQGTSQKLRNYNSVTKLGLAAITNSSQGVNTAAVASYARTFKAFAKSATPEGKAFVSKTGVIAESILHDLADEKGFGRGLIAKIAMPGFNTVESSNRSVAALAGRQWAMDLARKGDPKSLGILTKKLGVTGDIGKDLTEAQQIQAARKLVEITQFKTSAMDMPRWASSPEGKLVAQFRSFSYKQGGFMLGEVLKPAAHGNFMPLSRILLALPLGYALMEGKNILRNRPTETDPVRLGLEVWANVGGGGLPVDVIRGLWPTNAKYLPSGTYAAQVAGTLGGPTVGLAGKVTDAVGGTITGHPEKLGRVGLQQLPLVGSTASNTLLPYKPGGRSGTTGVASVDDFDKQQKADAATKKQNMTPQQKADAKFLGWNKDEQKAYIKSNPSDADRLNKLITDKKAADAQKSRDKAADDLDVTGISPESADVLKKYTKLDDKGKKAFMADGNNEYALKYAQYEQDKAAGKLTPEQDYTQNKDLTKLNIVKDFPAEVRQMYAMSKADLNNFISANPDKADLLGQVYNLDNSITTAGYTAKLKFGNTLGSTRKGRKPRTVKPKKVRSRTVKLKTAKVKAVKVPTLKSALMRAKGMKI